MVSRPVATTCCSYLVADKATGEIPTIPASLNALSRAAARVSKASGFGAGAATGDAADPLVLLPSMVFKIMEGALASHVLSPLTTMQLLWFVERWMASYFMPDLTLYSEPLSTTLTRCVGVRDGLCRASRLPCVRPWLSAASTLAPGTSARPACR